MSWTVSGTGGTYNTDDGSYTGAAAPAGALVMIDDFQVRVVPVEAPVEDPVTTVETPP